MHSVMCFWAVTKLWQSWLHIQLQTKQRALFILPKCLVQMVEIANGTCGSNRHFPAQIDDLWRYSTFSLPTEIAKILVPLAQNFYFHFVVFLFDLPMRLQVWTQNFQLKILASKLKMECTIPILLSFKSF